MPFLPLLNKEKIMYCTECKCGNIGKICKKCGKDMLEIRYPWNESISEALKSWLQVFIIVALAYSLAWTIICFFNDSLRDTMLKIMF